MEQWLDELEMMDDLMALEPTTSFHPSETSASDPIVINVLYHSDKPRRAILEDDAKLQSQFRDSEDEAENTNIGPDLDRIAEELHDAKLYEEYSAHRRPFRSRNFLDNVIKIKRNDNNLNKQPSIQENCSHSDSNEVNRVKNQPSFHVSKNKNASIKMREANPKHLNDTNECNTPWTEVGSGDTTPTMTSEPPVFNLKTSLPDSKSTAMNNQIVTSEIPMGDRILLGKRNILVTYVLKDSKEEGNFIIDTNQTIEITPKACSRENEVVIESKKEIVVIDANEIIEAEEEIMNIFLEIVPHEENGIKKDIENDEDESLHRNISVGDNTREWRNRYNADIQVEKPIHNIDTNFAWSSNKKIPSVESNLSGKKSPSYKSQSLYKIEQNKPSENHANIRRKLAADNGVEKKSTDGYWLASKVQDAEDANARETQLREEEKQEVMNTEYRILPHEESSIKNVIENDKDESLYRNTSVGDKIREWRNHNIADIKIEAPIHNVDTKLGWASNIETPSVKSYLSGNKKPINESKTIYKIEQSKPSDNHANIRQKLAADNGVVKKTKDGDGLASIVQAAENVKETELRGEEEQEIMNIEYRIILHEERSNEEYIENDNDEIMYRNTSVDDKVFAWLQKQFNDPELKTVQPNHNIDLKFGWSLNKEIPAVERNLHENKSPVNKNQSKSKIEPYKPSENFAKIRQKLTADNGIVKKKRDDYWWASKIQDAEDAYAKKKKLKGKDNPTPCTSAM